jgi:hypothetical protein
MFANLLRLITGQPPADQSSGFVEEIKLVEHVRPRNPRAVKLFLLFWLLIAAKCWLVVWLIERYHMDLNPLWVNAPTIAFALLCTGAYFFRD